MNLCEMVGVYKIFPDLLGVMWGAQAFSDRLWAVRGCFGGARDL